jgi:PEP-CTERM motif
MRKPARVLAVLGLGVATMTTVAVTKSAAAIIGYDGRTGAVLNFSGTTPRTFIGQAFDIADPGGPPEIISIDLVMFATTAINYQNTQIRLQFWNSYNDSANPVFSNPVSGLQLFTTGPIAASGITAFEFNFKFAPPIPLTGLTGHGLTVNWQSDPAGTGTFADDDNITAALRASGSADINPGVNDNPSSGYYRNASGETDFNFQSPDARILQGATNGGLVFALTVDAVPEPGTATLVGLGIVGLLAIICRRR